MGMGVEDYIIVLWLLGHTPFPELGGRLLAGSGGDSERRQVEAKLKRDRW